MIHITRTHTLEPAVARQRLENVAQALAAELGLTYHWEGDRLLFKRWGAKGTIALHPGRVEVEVKTSPLLPISEAGLRREIERRIDSALVPPAPTSEAPEPVSAPEPEDTLGSLLGQALGLTGQMVNLGTQALASTGLLPSFTSLAEAGAHLRAAREHAGLSLQELSKALNVQPAFLKAVENGTARLTAELIIRISDLVARGDPAQLAKKLAQVYQTDAGTPPADIDP